jgi:hypothetical protein
MSTLTLFQGFCVFVQFFMFKNTIEKLPKMDFVMVFLYTLMCSHPPKIGR